MKKKILAILMALGLLVTTGCSANGNSSSDAKKSDKLKVTVTTSFLQDMVTQLAGDKVKISLIIPAGEDPHTYEAKAEDNKKLSSADLVLYHGLHFEGKMVELLESVKGKPIAKHFEKSEVGKMEEDGKTITDPHFWFDIDLYKKAVKEAAVQLKNKLPKDKDLIEKNEKNYLKKLDELDKFNRQELNKIPKESRILVTPHDAFNYFSRRYNIEVKAPQGVSTDSELSTNDMAETAKFIVAHKIKAIFAESTTDPARMKKLQESCKSKGWDVKVVSGKGQELFSDSLAPKGEKSNFRRINNRSCKNEEATGIM